MAAERNWSRAGRPGSKTGTLKSQDSGARVLRAALRTTGYDVTFSCLRRGWGVSDSAAGAASCFRFAGSAAAGAASASVRSAACSGFTAAASLAAVLPLPASAALRPLSRAYMEHSFDQHNPQMQCGCDNPVSMHISLATTVRTHRNAASCVCVKRWCFLLPFRRHRGCFGVWRLVPSSGAQAGGAERRGLPAVALAGGLCCRSLQRHERLATVNLLRDNMFDETCPSVYNTKWVNL